ncbi:MAG TPA: M10 family metallopeptidase C-terminal domain-containing protein [Allosphingosinicella sp.]|nr:M10 family metallopeptidase C-terminal domain-containing protein [Allosphingosinicella sp.]
MPGFRDRFSRTNSFDLWTQNAANDPVFRGYEKAAGPSAAIVSPGPQALIDTVPGDTSTTFTLTVDAAPIVSAVDTIADEDFYSITLIAGHQYQIGMYAYSPQGPGDPVGPNGVPLSDSYLELYDSNGVLITAADGGSDTTFNTANSGFDALLTFTATTTGTYYVNARAFDNTPLDGSDNGDVVGDYGLYAKDVTGDESLYTPYYSPNSPLYAIDWGTQVNKIHQTYRNPDGNEGTRDTGNPQSQVDPGALLGHPGKNVISIYFAQAGDIFVSNDPTNPGLPPATITAVGVQQFEHDAVMTALAEFAKVADIVYVVVTDRAQADFIYTSYQGTPGPGVSLLGSMSPPDESDEGLAQFNSGDSRWNAVDLQQGGFSFVTLIHEFGHGHGLAHPHDNGGHSGIMNGVEPEGAGVADYTTGDFDLNQGVFTMMSYEDGWQTSPHNPHNAPTTGGYGYLGGLMAFDIAAIQDKYGVNEDTATGNDTYAMKDVNAPGTYYYCIWDAAGIDAITYGGARDATIDLRPATLQYEYGGGGRVSYALGIYGGFTIANGVTIENATTGSGNDHLVGNAVNNVLDGGGGNDLFDLSGGGDDHAIGGAGDDGFLFGAAFTPTDFVEGGAGANDQIGLQGNYAGGNALTLGAGTMTGIEAIVVLPGFSYDLTLNDGNVAAGGLLKVQATQLAAGQSLHFNGSAEHDGSFLTFGGQGDDSFIGGWGNDGFYFGPGGFNSADVVNGGLGANDQLGLDGDYGSVGSPLVLGSNVTNVEVVVLMAGPSGTPNHFNVSTSDVFVGSGQTMTIFGLQTSTGFTFDGSNEHDGAFRVYGGTGNDVITGSTGADWLFGGDGTDTLTGGAGNDIFYYDALSQSNPTIGRDGIQDFSTGDKMDFSGIDAIAGGGDDAFSFIGSGAFTNHAGELRAVTSGGGIWTVSGDVDGNGVADFELLVVVSDAHSITSADFTL